MSPLQIVYILDIIVATPVALATLTKNQRAARFFFKEGLPQSDSLRTVLGALWMGVLCCSIAGVFFPVAMSPILLLQVIYKFLWLMLFATPRWLTGRAAEVPRRIAGICILTLLIFPWVIPWTTLFSVNSSQTVAQQSTHESQLSPSRK